MYVRQSEYKKKHAHNIMLAWCSDVCSQHTSVLITILLGYHALWGLCPVTWIQKLINIKHTYIIVEKILV